MCNTEQLEGHKLVRTIKTSDFEVTTDGNDNNKWFIDNPLDGSRRKLIMCMLGAPYGS